MGTQVEEFLAEMLPRQRAAVRAYHNGDVNLGWLSGHIAIP